MRSSVSIALFFLLSGFFLFTLLAAIEHSRKAAAIAGVCLVAVVCIIVFLTPVRLPDWMAGHHADAQTTTTTTASPAGSTSSTTTDTSDATSSTVTGGAATTMSTDTTTTTRATSGATTTTERVTTITGTGL